MILLKPKRAREPVADFYANEVLPQFDGTPRILLDREVFGLDGSFSDQQGGLPTELGFLTSDQLLQGGTFAHAAAYFSDQFFGGSLVPVAFANFEHLLLSGVPALDPGLNLQIDTRQLISDESGNSFAGFTSELFSSFVERNLNISSPDGVNFSANIQLFGKEGGFSTSHTEFGNFQTGVIGPRGSLGDVDAQAFDLAKLMAAFNGTTVSGSSFFSAGNEDFLSITDDAGNQTLVVHYHIPGFNDDQFVYQGGFEGAPKL